MISEDNRCQIRTTKPRLKHIDGKCHAWFDDVQTWLIFNSLKTACLFISKKIKSADERY